MMIKKERREHHRFPIISELVEPILIKVSPVDFDEEIPGIMMNLSAGGMVVVTFVSLPLETQLDLNINIPGLKIEHSSGKVVRLKERAGTYLVGINFTSLDKKAKECINHMAKDFNDCREKYYNGEKNICFKECSYYSLCSQPIKGHVKNKSNEI